MRNISCPLCKRKYNNKKTTFTLTKPNKKMLETLDYEIVNKIKQSQGWINACAWCFEKSINVNDETLNNNVDDDIKDVFNSLTK